MSIKHWFRSFLDGQFSPRLLRMRDRPIRDDNPLLSLFSDGQTIAETGAKTLDWDNYGIRSPYIIFITGRCGSTLLTHLIRDTRLAGNPTEHFNIDWVKKFSPITSADFLERAIREASNNGFFGFEIDWIHLRFLDPFLDFTSTFSAETTKFFYMTRRDILAQALSYASAKATGIWQNYSATTDSNVSRPTAAQALDDQAVWREIMLILESEMRFEQFFKRNRIKPIRIDYEMLIASKRDVLGLVLLNIGCDIESIAAKTDKMVDKTLKIPRDQFVFSLTFRERYADLLSSVERVRGSNHDAIQSQLRKQGIDWGNLNS
jgi:LPS sulfotransferase NodH